jgi:hypothetical protein
MVASGVPTKSIVWCSTYIEGVVVEIETVGNGLASCYGGCSILALIYNFSTEVTSTEVAFEVKTGVVTVARPELFKTTVCVALKLSR